MSRNKLLYFNIFKNRTKDELLIELNVPECDSFQDDLIRLIVISILDLLSLRAKRGHLLQILFFFNKSDLTLSVFYEILKF